MSDPTTAEGNSGWRPDPYRRHELRFLDGELWTEHVSDRGIAGIDTVPVADLPRSRPPDRTAGVATPPVLDRTAVRVLPDMGGAPVGLLDAHLLVVDEPAIGVEGKGGLDLAVHDEHGLRVATVRFAREQLGARTLRLLTTQPSSEISEVLVFDPVGALALVLERPTHLLTPRIRVKQGDGTLLGELVPVQMLTGLRYAIEVGGSVVGHITGADPFDRQLHAADAAGAPLARVSTAWEVPSASYHPRAHTFLVLLEPAVPQPLRSIVVAALLALDAMLVPEPVAHRDE